jgi:DNA processing protein
VIVEAAERSGSLITARLAAEQNREVFAVPGHPYEPRAAGTNQLIKDGAIFTTSPADIEEALQPLLAGWECAAPGRTPNPLTLEARAGTAPSAAHRETPESWGYIGEAAEKVLKLLSFSPIDIDEICRLSGLEARQVNAALLSLDLSGRIERRGLRQILLRP